MPKNLQKCPTCKLPFFCSVPSFFSMNVPASTTYFNDYTTLRDNMEFNSFCVSEISLYDYLPCVKDIENTLERSAQNTPKEEIISSAKTCCTVHLSKYYFIFQIRCFFPEFLLFEFRKNEFDSLFGLSKKIYTCT